MLRWSCGQTAHTPPPPLPPQLLLTAALAARATPSKLLRRSSRIGPKRWRQHPTCARALLHQEKLVSNSPQTAAGHVLAAYAPAGGFRGYMDAMKNAHSFSPPIPFQHPGTPISDQKVKIQKHQIAVTQGEPLAPKFPQLSRLLLVASYPH